MSRTTFRIVAMLFIAGWAGAVVTSALALPKPVALPQSADSPGVVTFNHESHVDANQPNCTSCHPTLFKILKRTARAPLTHDGMTQGRACGACHGKTSFGFEDDCTMCHRS